eukprot:s426_g8.t1
MANFYEILQLRSDATVAEIRAAYKRKALEVHPDKGGSAGDFQLVLAAFEQLVDPALRRSYDQRARHKAFCAAPGAKPGRLSVSVECSGQEGSDDVSGSVAFHTSGVPCLSCVGVAAQFKRHYPRIRFCFTFMNRPLSEREGVDDAPAMEPSFSMAPKTPRRRTTALQPRGATVHRKVELGTSTTLDTGKSGAAMGGQDSSPGCFPTSWRMQQYHSQREEFENRVKFLETVPLLANQLPRADLPTLAAALVEKRFRPGEYLARQGAVGRELNIVKTGTCAVMRKTGDAPKDSTSTGFPSDDEEDQRIATLWPGDWSGGQALVETRTFRASVVAEEPGVVVLSISREGFEALGLHQRLHFPRRNAMYEGRAKKAGNVVKRMPGVEHIAGKLTEDEISFIARSIGRNPNLRSAMDMAKSGLEVVGYGIESGWLDLESFQREIGNGGDLELGSSDVLGSSPGSVGLGLAPEASQGVQTFTLAEVQAATQQLCTKLGGGFNGTVYKGALGCGTPVAVKLSDPGSFAAEAKVLARLPHPNISTLIGASFPSTLVYELADRDLRARLCSDEHKEFHRKDRLNIAAQVSAAGCRPRIFHRDITLDNILIANNTAKLADFGMAMLSEEPTVLSEVVGAVEYQCPRFQETKLLSEQAEVFSLGIIIFDLLTRSQTARHGPPQVLAVAHAQVEERWPEHLSGPLINLALECTGDSRPCFAKVSADLRGLSLFSSSAQATVHAAPLASSTLEMPQPVKANTESDKSRALQPPGGPAPVETQPL